MGKSFTSKSRYKSKYSPEAWVTAAQYITELICRNKAKKELPIKFYELKEWQKYYKWQIGLANKLLKKYDERAIINILKKSKIYSLQPKWVEEAIDVENDIIKARDAAHKIAEKNSSEEIDRNDQKTYKRVTSGSSKSLLSKLDEI